MSNFKKYMSVVEALNTTVKTNYPSDFEVDGKPVNSKNATKIIDEKIYKNIVLDTIESFIKDDNNQEYINEITKTSGKGNYKGVPGESILLGMMQSRQPLSEEAFENLINELDKKEVKIFVDKVISYYTSLLDQELTKDEFSKTINNIANI